MAGALRGLDDSIAHGARVVDARLLVVAEQLTRGARVVLVEHGEGPRFATSAGLLAPVLVGFQAGADLVGRLGGGRRVVVAFHDGRAGVGGVVVTRDGDQAQGQAGGRRNRRRAFVRRRTVLGGSQGVVAQLAGALLPSLHGARRLLPHGHGSGRALRRGVACRPR